MQKVNDNLSVRGVVTYRLTNAETGKVDEEKTQTNVITTKGLRLISSGAQTGYHVGISSQTTEARRWVPLVTGIMEVGYQDTGVARVNWFEANESEGTPMYAQWQRRFNQPSSTRTINTITLNDNNYTGDQEVSAYVKLDTPCIQETNQILDIFYRIQFIQDPQYGVPEFAIRGLALASIGGSTSNLPNNVGATWSPNIARDDWFSIDHYSSTDYFDNVSTDWYGLGYYSNSDAVGLSSDSYEYRRDFSWSVARAYGGDPSGGSWPHTGKIFSGLNFYDGYSQSLGRAKVISNPADYIQPIFFHKADSPRPFQDVNYLSNGSGNMNLSGTWNRKDIPTWNTVSITKDGISGNAEYSFKQRKFLGWTGDTYENRVESLKFTAWSRTTEGEGWWGTKTYFFAQRYNLLWNEDRIRVANMVTGDYEEYSPRTIPALSASDIAQASAGWTATSDVWVADKLEGLFKINRQSNTVSKISFIDPVIDDNRAYAVSVHGNGDVMAIMEGGLVISSDEGLTWSVHHPGSSVQFNHPSVTDNVNWNNVGWIRASGVASDATNQCAIATKDGKVIWWSKGESGLGETISGFEVLGDEGLTAYINNLLWKCPNNCTPPETDNNSRWLFQGAAGSSYNHYYSFVAVRTFADTGSNPGPNSRVPGAVGWVYSESGIPYYILSYAAADNRNSTSEDVYFINAISGQIYDNLKWQHGLFRHFGVQNSCIIDNALVYADRKIMALANPVTNHSSAGNLENFAFDHYGYNSSTGNWEKDYEGTAIATNGFSDRRIRRRGMQNNSWLLDGKQAYMDMSQPTINAFELETHTQAFGFTIESSQVPDGNTKYAMSLSADSFEVIWQKSDAPEKMGIAFKNGRNNTDNSISWETLFWDRPQDSNPHRIFIVCSSPRNADKIVNVWMDGQLVVDPDWTTKNFMPHTKALTAAFNNYYPDRWVFGNRVSRNPINAFEGRISDIAVYTDRHVIGSELAQLDYANMNNKSWHLENYTLPYTQSLVGIDKGVAVGSVNLSYDYANGTFENTSTADTNNRSIWSNINSWNQTIALECNMTNSEMMFGYKVASVLFDNNDTHPVIKYGLKIYTNDTVQLWVDGSLHTSLGVQSPGDVWEIELDNATLHVYKNNVLQQSFVDIVEEYNLPEEDMTLKVRASMVAAVKFDDYGRGSGQIHKWEYTDTIVPGQFLVNHWPLDETTVEHGCKQTHTALEHLIDGVTIQFNDEPGAPLQWVASDFYSFGLLDGFLNDNIRTYSGGYSFWYRPAVQLQNEFVSNVIASSNSAVSAITGGTYNEYAIGIGNNITNTGAWHPEFLWLDTDNRDRKFHIYINGQEALSYRYDRTALADSREDQSGTRVYYYAAIGNNHFSNYVGSTINFRLKDGSVHSTTITSYGPSTRYIDIADAIPGNNPLEGGSPMWVIDPINDPAPGEVTINKHLGIIRFNSADAGRIVTGDAVYLYDS